MFRIRYTDSYHSYAQITLGDPKGNNHFFWFYKLKNGDTHYKLKAIYKYTENAPIALDIETIDNAISFCIEYMNRNV